MLYKQIKYFIAVKEYNSFTEAAQNLYISQSAVSQQIKALENELGVDLIERENRSFKLTTAGEYFYKHCRLIVDDIDRLCKETKRIAEDKDAVIKIGYLIGCSSKELNQAFFEFSKTYPDVDIQIISGTHEELYNKVRDNEVDLVLNDQRRAFSDEYMNYQVFNAECYVELSKNNSLCKCKNVCFEELKNFPCILISPKEQREVESDYYKNTLGYNGNFLFAENLEEARLLVMSNKGFFISGNIGSSSEDDYINKIPIFKGNKPLIRKFCAFWLKNNSGYYIEEFVEILYRLLNK